MDISKKIYYSASFLALKMAAMVHRARVENCQIGQNCQNGQGVVGCGQISLASNSKANGLNEAIPSQVWCTLLC